MTRSDAAIPAHLLRDGHPPLKGTEDALRRHRQAARDNPLPEAALPPPVPAAFLAQHPLAPVATQQGLLACLHERHAASVIYENGYWQRGPHFNPALAPANAASLAHLPEQLG